MKDSRAQSLHIGGPTGKISVTLPAPAIRRNGGVQRDVLNTKFDLLLSMMEKRERSDQPRPRTCYACKGNHFIVMANQAQASPAPSDRPTPWTWGLTPLTHKSSPTLTGSDSTDSIDSPSPSLAVTPVTQLTHQVEPSSHWLWHDSTSRASAFFHLD